jgi:putative solute:sodium symporter small subunit
MRQSMRQPSNQNTAWVAARPSASASNTWPLSEAARGIALSGLSPASWKAHKVELILLGLWLVFFLFVNAFVRALNTITVPLLEMPLGLYLAIQGALILFAALLFRFTRPGP